MHHTAIELLTSLLVAVALWGSGCQRAAPNASNTKNPGAVGGANVIEAWGTEAGGLRSRISIDRQRFDSVQPIIVHYAIQNASDKPIVVWHSGFWPNHRIDVTGPDGQPAKFATGGEARWTAFTPGGTREKNAPKTLRPGEIDEAYEAYNLRDIFTISAPGEYRVQYLYQEAKEDVPVNSNELTFIVE